MCLELAISVHHIICKLHIYQVYLWGISHHLWPTNIILLISLGLSPCLQTAHTHTHTVLPWGCVMHAVRPDKWKCPGRGMSWCLDLPPGMGILLQTALSPDKWSKWYTHHSVKNIHFQSNPPCIQAINLKHPGSYTKDIQLLTFFD